MLDKYLSPSDCHTRIVPTARCTRSCHTFHITDRFYYISRYLFTVPALFCDRAKKYQWTNGYKMNPNEMPDSRIHNHTLLIGSVTVSEERETDSPVYAVPVKVARSVAVLLVAPHTDHSYIENFTFCYPKLANNCDEQ